MRRRITAVAALLLGACEQPIYMHGVRECREGTVNMGNSCADGTFLYAIVGGLSLLFAIWTTVRIFDFMRTVESRLRAIDDKLTPPKD